MASLENSLADNGPTWEHAEETKREIERLRAACIEKGGKL
jgi:hypothetical protein